MYAASDRLLQFKAQMEPALVAYDATITPTVEIAIKKNAATISSYREKRGAWLSKPVVFVGGFGPRNTFQLVSTSSENVKP